MAERHPAYDGFISIHALREESDKFEGDDHGIDAKISIHALREEGDIDAGRLALMDDDISIHALRGESDLLPACTAVCSLLISIHALRGESDYIRPLRPVSHGNFNPRPPRGGRLSDLVFDEFIPENFNPRPPRGGRPGTLSTMRRQKDISIHALREEGDGAGQRTIQ